MKRPDYGKMLRELDKSDLTLPGLKSHKKMGVPPAIAKVFCPHCNQEFPVTVQMQRVSFAVGYPVAKGSKEGGIRLA